MTTRGGPEGPGIAGLANEPGPRPPGIRAPVVGFAITLLVCVPVTIVLTWPQALGAQRLPGVAQLIALRAALAIVLLVVAVIAAGLLLLLRRRSRLFAAVLAGLALAMLAASIGNVSVLASRGISAGGADELPRGDVTVLVWNTQGGATSPEAVAELVIAVRADIVSLPEMDEEAVAEVARLVGLDGLHMVPSTTRAIAGSLEESWIPTSLLVAADLGAYTLDESAGSTPGLPSGVWRPAVGDGPTIVSAHPAPPLAESLDDWNAGLRWITEQCNALGPDVIVAGDFNATVDHLDLGACQDAAAQANTSATGTWPSTAPAWLASPIDQVLAGPAWTVLEARVITPSTPGGTDHRPVVAVLAKG